MREAGAIQQQCVGGEQEFGVATASCRLSSEDSLAAGLLGEEETFIPAGLVKSGSYYQSCRACEGCAFGPRA